LYASLGTVSLDQHGCPAGHRPSIAEAIAKLEVLRAKGSTAEAFTFRQALPPPDAIQSQPSPTFGDEYPAT
jgi:hypothetical protein